MQAAGKTSHVTSASTRVAANVGAGNDSTVLPASQTIIYVATEVKIPVYVSNYDSEECPASTKPYLNEDCVLKHRNKTTNGHLGDP